MKILKGCMVVITGLLLAGLFHFSPVSMGGHVLALHAGEVEEDPELRFPDEPPPEPSGFRMNDYRTVVPLSLKGATVVSNLVAMKLHKEGQTLFIDVMPFTPKPPNLPKDIIWRDKPRDNIPGSVWLANVGYGRLPQEMSDFFSHHLARLTKGQKDQPLLFYCQRDCWMSWNAAKRALDMGYISVYWYPLGTDGWVTIGGKVVPAKPVPLPDLTRAINP